MMALFIALSGLLAAGEIVEPNTGVAFDPVFALEGKELVLTGTDRRRALGRDAYAVAHYIDPGAFPAEGEAASRLDECIAAGADKVMIFHGVYPSVPAHGIRHSWKKHFRDLGVESREDFIDAFTEPFKKNQRLYFIARASGELEVRHDACLIGEWKDPELVRALWAMCLGPTTEIVNRENLAALRPTEVALRAPVDETPTEQQTP